MQVGLGLDPTLRLSSEEQEAVAGEAARLGYASLWTPAGADAAVFDTCALWHAASGLPVGIAVVPTPRWSLDDLVARAARLHELTRGSFTLGVGSGGARPGAVTLMADHLRTLRRALPAGLPLYLGALGPRMLRLAGALADGVALNWCSAEHLGWSRTRIHAGAPSREVAVVEYVRVCVDDDPDRARHALARAALGYALVPAYRAHFLRMGFGRLVGDLEARRARGSSDDALADALPAGALRRFGASGAPADAAAGLRSLGAGLDVAIVRVVASRPGLEAVLATVRACAPSA